MALGADQTNNLVFIQHHHQLHIGKYVVDLIRPGVGRVPACQSAPLDVHPPTPLVHPHLPHSRSSRRRHRVVAGNKTSEQVRGRRGKYQSSAWLGWWVVRRDEERPVKRACECRVHYSIIVVVFNKHQVIGLCVEKTSQGSLIQE